MQDLEAAFTEMAVSKLTRNDVYEVLGHHCRHLYKGSMQILVLPDHTNTGDQDLQVWKELDFSHAWRKFYEDRIPDTCFIAFEPSDYNIKDLWECAAALKYEISNGCEGKVVRFTHSPSSPTIGDYVRKWSKVRWLCDRHTLEDLYGDDYLHYFCTRLDKLTREIGYSMKRFIVLCYDYYQVLAAIEQSITNSTMSDSDKEEAPNE